MTLDVDTVRDLLFGETDVRQPALFLAQQSLTMDAVEREQRRVILEALTARANQELAASTALLGAETMRMVVATQKVAKWTMILALATFALALCTILIAIVD